MKEHRDNSNSRSLTRTHILLENWVSNQGTQIAKKRDLLASWNCLRWSKLILLVCPRKFQISNYSCSRSSYFNGKELWQKIGFSTKLSLNGGGSHILKMARFTAAENKCCWRFDMNSKFSRRKLEKGLRRRNNLDWNVIYPTHTTLLLQAITSHKSFSYINQAPF